MGIFSRHYNNNKISKNVEIYSEEYYPDSRLHSWQDIFLNYDSIYVYCITQFGMAIIIRVTFTI